MKYFLEMAEHARLGGITAVADEAGRLEKIASEHFFKTIEKTQPFVFANGTVPMKDVTVTRAEGGGSVHKKLDAPFPIFSIETLDGMITIPTLTQRVDYFTYCILGYERAPCSFAYYALIDVVQYEPVEEKGQKGIVESSRNRLVIHTHMYDAVVSEYLEKINTQQMGLEKVRQKIKIGTGQEKRFHTIKKIIHIRPKVKQTVSENPGTRNIDWSHRWSVRGHWRQISGSIGKDREGLPKADWTWVKEHERGPEGLPLVKKTRILEEVG